MPASSRTLYRCPSLLLATQCRFLSCRRFPKHTHVGGEEFLVLEGTFKDEYGEFPAGTYVRNPIGTEHAPWVDNDGCTIFVKLLQMGDTDAKPLYVNLDTEKEQRGKPAPYGTVLELYRNPYTGEVVEMCWMDPGAIVVPHNDNVQGQSSSVGGEELFIVEGSVCLGDDCYGKWGWLRFPAGHHHDGLFRRHPVVAGRSGAKVFRKTGHLTAHALSLAKIHIQEDD